ncbi:MAG: hypothetical protein LBB60_05550 [Desulfovibrio sp.]|jgi:hypothetical protein|nr:hypothetical protein [Desulfovibrio sp.]
MLFLQASSFFDRSILPFSAEIGNHVELDEMWHYLRSKKTNFVFGKLIVAIPVSSLTGNVGIVIMRTFSKLMTRLRKWKIWRYCVDNWKVYPMEIPSDNGPICPLSRQWSEGRYSNILLLIQSFFVYSGLMWPIPERTKRARLCGPAFFAIKPFASG